MYRTRRASLPAVVVLTLAVLVGTVWASSASAAKKIFATGLENARGLAFGADGFLYVAEAGRGGTQTTTPAQCTQAPPPVGPYGGGFTARISKISPAGLRTTVAEGLPSSQTYPASGSFVSGVAAVAFVRGQLYGIEAGAGCSHGLAGTTTASSASTRTGRRLRSQI